MSKDPALTTPAFRTTGLLALTLAALATAAAPALAQTATPAAPAAAKPKPRPEARRPAAPKPPPPPAPLVLEPAQGEQLAAAAMIHYGDYACEFQQSISVGLTPGSDGYVDLKFGPRTYTMKPVLSTTGALRLEDMRGEALLVQIAFKSMLMDTKNGRRMLDDCVHPKQIEAKAGYEAVASKEGIGISTTPAPAAAPVTTATGASPPPSTVPADAAK